MGRSTNTKPIEAESRTDIYRRVTDRIVAAIEAGLTEGKTGMPWHRKSHGGTATGLPMNAASKTSYRGVNVPVLWATADAAGYTTGLWATYKQWGEMGAFIGSPDDLCQWLMEQDIAVVSDLFAFCIAQGLDAGTQDWTEAPDCFPAKLAQGLGLKMGDWWRPSVDSFFGKVTKAIMLLSVTEAAGPSVAGRMDGMKKDTMAKTAEEVVKGTTWLPTLLRVPEPVRPDA